MLIITKVEDPEELDTRFSKFAPSSISEWDAKKKDISNKLEGADTLLDLLGKMKEKFGSATASDTDESTAPSETADTHTSELRLFSFATMEGVLKAAHLLDTMYSGSNTLYKDPGENIYILALSQSEHTTRDFNRICNMLSEYGTLEVSSGATLAFLEEHCEILVSANAVQELSKI